MLLGVVLHAALFLIPDAWPVQDKWAYMSAPDSNPYIYIVSAIHGFRMPVFFLMSGFFTAMLWQRRGVKEMGLHRIKRIGIPLVVGAVTIIPISVWLMDLANFHLVWWPLYWLESLHHLWFLWMLLMLAAGFVVVTRFGLRFTHSVWWLMIPSALVPQVLMSEPIFGPDTSDGAIPDPVVLAYFAMFFAFGVFWYQRGKATRQWWAVAIVPSLAVILLPGMYFAYEAEGFAGRLIGAVLQVLYAWLMCFGMMGLFRWIGERERFWVQFLSDASYWIYLWHLPLIVAGQRLLVDLPIDPHAKFVLLILSVPAILLVVYQIGVRYTPVGTLLNGRRARQSGADAAPVPCENARKI